MVEFKLPDVGEGMHEGEILTWLVKEGDFVKRDQPVLEVQTDKVNAELTAPVAGVINKIFFPEGEVVEVGTTIFTILPEGQSAPVVQEDAITKVEEDVEVAPATKNTPVLDITRALATPYVRQLAREMKVDLDKVRGTGPAGRITEQDLQAFANGEVEEKVTPKAVESQASTTTVRTNENIGALEERLPIKGIRKKIAEHMVKSVSTIPHVTHFDELEMDQLKAMREQMKPFAEKKDIKLTFLPFFIKAIVTALKEFKTLNASIDDAKNEIVLKNYYHIGIATDTPEGLIVPVIKDADKKSVFQIAAEITELATKARDGKLAIHEITGSTFTISNVGGIGGLFATPIINHPEVAILALHKMEPRMVVRDMEGVIRMMMNMSLSFDHRIIDGVTAVRFTNRIKELLENPNLLFMEMN